LVKSKAIAEAITV